MSLLRVGRWLACCLLLGGAPAASGAPSSRAKPRLDRYGDPLPRSAVARLGSLRHRENGRIDAVVLSPDGRLLATVSGDEILKVREGDTGRLLWSFSRVATLVCSRPVFSADSRFIAALCDKGLFVWEAASATASQRRRPFPERRPAGLHPGPLSDAGRAGKGSQASAVGYCHRKGDPLLRVHFPDRRALVLLP